MKGFVFLLLICGMHLYAGELVLESIKVKGREEVLYKEGSGTGNLKDAGEFLERTSGIWKLRKGGIANDILIRGFKGSDINILYDSSKIYSACPMRMDPPLFHVDLSEIEHIKIIKGPFDVKHYGVVGGSLNLITRKPKRGLRQKLEVNLGSFSYASIFSETSYRKGYFYGSLGYSYRYSKAYKTGGGKLFTEYSNYKDRFKDTTAFNTNTLWLKAGYAPSKRNGLEISYTAQRLRDILYPYLLMDSPEDNADRIFLKLRLGNFTAESYYSYIYHLMDNTKRNAGMFMQTESGSLTYGLRFDYRIREILLGMEAFRWHWSAETTMGNMKQFSLPDVLFQDMGVFGELGKVINKNIKIKLGIRIDSALTIADEDKANLNLYYTYHGTRKSRVEEIYPSGNVQVYYSADKDTKFFLLLGYAVRSPNPQERFFALNRSGVMEAMYGDWVGNPDLKPTRNAQIDLGFDKKGTNYRLKTAVFYSNVKDLVTLYEANNIKDTGLGSKAKSYTNVDAHIYGTEIEGFLALGNYIFIEGSLSYARGIKEIYPERGIKDRDIAEMPPLKGRISFRYERLKYFGEIETLLQDTQYNVDSDLDETQTPGWAVVNLKGGIRYGRLSVTAGVNNIFDKLYYEHLSYLRDPFGTGVKLPEPGRELFLTVGFTF